MDHTFLLLIEFASFLNEVGRRLFFHFGHFHFGIGCLLGNRG